MDLNHRPTHYECVALPTELKRQRKYIYQVNLKMQVFFCMVDKKKSCPMRGRKKKRAGAAETAGAGDKMRDPQAEYRGAGAAETASFPRTDAPPGGTACSR